MPYKNTYMNNIHKQT